MSKRCFFMQFPLEQPAVIRRYKGLIILLLLCYDSLSLKEIHNLYLLIARRGTRIKSKLIVNGECVVRESLKRSSQCKLYRSSRRTVKFLLLLFKAASKEFTSKFSDAESDIPARNYLVLFATSTLSGGSSESVIVARTSSRKDKRVGGLVGDATLSSVERVMVVLIVAELDRASSLSALNEMTCLHMEPRRTGGR
ncbi:uncharacterized protein LOC143148425 [Ptiloglossa arizonensis]|uniref:uncharacterized protein LOC143148425 n=1 Tax=Ptiloglossa arizonensis TaxID=3350558 RepID=UPI003FA079E1